MKFNSQICTSREQSERLLALGLKRETADVCYQIAYWDCGLLKECSPSLIPHNIIDGDRFIPAWSLGRLIEMIPEYFADTKLKFRIEAVKWLMQREGNVYDNLVILIADCIKHDIFNKEYLEE